MGKKTSEIHIGTSGWSYKHWAGLFYPDDVKPAKYLEYYTSQFDCVELNSSFYHLPKAPTTEGWKVRTPANFLFCPKLSRYISHRLKLSHPEEALENFFEVIGIMHDRLGPVLIQLPPGLKYDRDKVDEFLRVLKSNYAEYRFAIEIRHQSWINDEFFESLSANDIAFVIADSGKRYP
ncbi:MAG TPA: DUF72 domain-containing protein, partial [Sunxiuqinia sp.]|nr:DUF72 domain-containing protein [Sunxiuqinia sp.]